jgi:hypothetical protein
MEKLEKSGNTEDREELEVLVDTTVSIIEGKQTRNNASC